MKVLIVFDSVYGNTEQIARAMGGAITGEVKMGRISEINPSTLEAVDLLIIGSPTHGGRATPAMLEFLGKVPGSAVKGVSVAAFDTRLTNKLVKIFGYAAGRIGGILKDKGGELVLAPEGFFVKASKGPLKEGELERAAGWAKEIVKSKG